MFPFLTIHWITYVIILAVWVMIALVSRVIRSNLLDNQISSFFGNHLPGRLAEDFVRLAPSSVNSL